MDDPERTVHVETESYFVRLRERGQMTVPRQVRERLAVEEGDVVRIVRVGDVYLLTPRLLRVPALADRIADLMEREGVSLSDLLAGLGEERRAIVAEQRPHA